MTLSLSVSFSPDGIDRKCVFVCVTCRRERSCSETAWRCCWEAKAARTTVVSTSMCYYICHYIFCGSPCVMFIRTACSLIVQIQSCQKLILSLSTGASSIESEGSDVRMMEGFTRSLPSSPLLNLRLAKITGRTTIYLSIYLSICLSICLSIYHIQYNNLSYVKYRHTHWHNTHSSHGGRNRWQSPAELLVATRH